MVHTKPMRIFLNFSILINLKYYDMKKISFLTVLLLFAISSFAQNITRGPDIGEIYILGLSKSGLDATIYRYRQAYIVVA